MKGHLLLINEHGALDVMTGWVMNSVDPNLSFRVSVTVCKVFNEVDLATGDRALDSKVVFLPTLLLVLRYAGHCSLWNR